MDLVLATLSFVVFWGFVWILFEVIGAIAEAIRGLRELPELKAELREVRRLLEGMRERE